MLKRYIAFIIDPRARVTEKTSGGWDDSYGTPTYSSDSLEEIEGCLRASLSVERNLMRVQIVDLHSGRIAKEFQG